MATIKLNLDLRRQTKEGTYPLVLLVVYNTPNLSTLKLGSLSPKMNLTLIFNDLFYDSFIVNS
jgi:hypothetical protein